MKKKLLVLAFNLLTIFVFSQSLKTEKYELFLLNLEENLINISKDFKMTNKTQYFYEGTIDVTYMNNGESKKFNFFFSSWDNKYKEFLIKDINNNNIGQRVYFEDKETAHIKKSTENISVKLRDNSNIENSILSSMIVWLNNQ